MRAIINLPDNMGVFLFYVFNDEFNIFKLFFLNKKYRHFPGCS